MVKFHPTDNELLEFSAGNLDWAIGICVSAHLQFCAHCKNKVMQYNSIGGAALANSVAQEVEEESFSTLMARIRKSGQVPTKSVAKALTPASKGDEGISELPEVVKKLMPKDKGLHWSFVSPSLRAARLETGQNKYEVCFHKIKRGGRVAEHDHNGLEVTLVLEGSFSDAEGNYSVGDYIVKQPGETHRPMAAQDRDCLCLSVCEAPVKVTGFMGKLVNPFLTIDPR